MFESKNIPMTTSVNTSTEQIRGSPGGFSEASPRSQQIASTSSSRSAVASVEMSGKSEESKKPSANKTTQMKIKGPLPPCRVCEDDASGFHYGVYTCEGCKVSDN